MAPPPDNQVKNSSSRLRLILKLLWVSLSFFVFIIISLELGAYLYYTVSTAISKLNDPVAVRVNAIPADAYEDRSWLLVGLREPRNELQWEPYTYWRRQPFSGSYVNIDDNGRRHTWNLPAHQPVNIYMFGGSTLWGIGARDDYTIPSFLSKMLTQAFPERIRVTNYGTTGFVNTQEMILLIRELQRGCRPQIVIFYDGYNDTFSAFQNRIAGIPLNEDNRVAEFNILQSSRTRDLFLAALKRSNIYNIIRDIYKKSFEPKQLQQLPSSPSKMENKLIVDVLNYYTTNNNIIEAIGGKMQFSPVFYWQPTPYTRVNRNRFEDNGLQIVRKRSFFPKLTRV